MTPGLDEKPTGSALLSAITAPSERADEIFLEGSHRAIFLQQLLQKD
jgi:hypothetical protein